MVKYTIQNGNVHILCSNCLSLAVTHAWISYTTIQLLYQFNYVLVQLIPFLRNTPLYFADIFNICRVSLFLQCAPDLVIHLVYVGTIGWPQIRWMKSGIISFRSLTALQARCTRALGICYFAFLIPSFPCCHKFLVADFHHSYQVISFLMHPVSLPSLY